jgi:exonuclease SbcD
LRYSFSELGHTKSVTLVDLPPDGPAQLTSVPLRQPHEMAVLTGTLAELLADDRYAEHWVDATVTDRSRPEQLFDRLKSHFPYLLHLAHAPAGARPAGTAAPAAAPVYTPRQLGADFIEHVTGLPAVDAELELFERAHEAAGIAEPSIGGG